MFESLQTFFTEGFHHEDVSELQSQHAYNERVYLFALKLINSIIDNPSLMRVFKTDYRQLMKEHTIISALNQFSFYISRAGKLLLFVDHKSKGAKYIDQILKAVHQKYRTVITMPKSPVSKETLTLLNDSPEQIKKWESYLKEIKDPSIVEIIGIYSMINNLLDKLSIELDF